MRTYNATPARLRALADHLEAEGCGPHEHSDDAVIRVSSSSAELAVIRADDNDPRTRGTR